MATDEKQFDVNAIDPNEEIDPRALALDLFRQLKESQANVRALLQLQAYLDEIHKYEKQSLKVCMYCAYALFEFSVWGIQVFYRIITSHYARKADLPITNLEYGRFVVTAVPVSLATVGYLTSLVFKIRRIGRLVEGWDWRTTSIENQKWGDLMESLPSCFGAVVLFGALVTTQVMIKIMEDS
ncbi:hypothetical protein DL98DRAFT_579436 [Cadophora sp. DSE1049]|nr:hypothetical protein DL98DRAFT_579436 [Cadophora sp. DSE1049]